MREEEGNASNLLVQNDNAPLPERSRGREKDVYQFFLRFTVYLGTTENTIWKQRLPKVYLPPSEVLSQFIS